VDRTLQILAALAAANTAWDVTHIIADYDFTFMRYIRNGNEILHFYTTYEIGGDILVATANNDDGMAWRMRFDLFASGAIPSDVLALLAFIE